jgi:transaldolase / glucose-6-phosphate isomerase
LARDAQNTPATSDVPPSPPSLVHIDTDELVERIWARDATVWTGREEAHWLGWLDEPSRYPREQMSEALDSLGKLDFSTCVLLGMGGSSLAPEVLRRGSGSASFHVLDTTHPAAIHALEDRIDPDETLFIAASKSGTTLETRCHMDYFWREGRAFAAITDPDSELEAFARERGFAAVVWGEPTIGGRYSALSPFGLVPAAVMGVDVDALMTRAVEMQEACRSDENPGLELGVALGSAWLEGRDKVVIDPNPAGFGLWAEQLLAESTGKDGKGLVPVVGDGAGGQDRQVARPEVEGPADLGAEFYRWEFATAVAATMLEVNPFDQPNVQEAKDRTTAVLSGHDRGQTPVMSERDVEELLAGAKEGDYIAIQAFIDPQREDELEPLVTRARETGCAVTTGLGPRYLHSTGQLHKGGPPKGRFIQVVDDPREELDIPGRPFGFAALIRAQAEGDFAALRERGRPVVRINLEDVR